MLAYSCENVCIGRDLSDRHASGGTCIASVTRALGPTLASGIPKLQQWLSGYPARVARVAARYTYEGFSGSLRLNSILPIHEITLATLARGKISNCEINGNWRARVGDEARLMLATLARVQIAGPNRPSRDPASPPFRDRFRPQPRNTGGKTPRFRQLPGSQAVHAVHAARVQPAQTRDCASDQGGAP